MRTIYTISLITLLSFGQTLFAQKLEKIRGDRNVTTEPVSIQAYQKLEVGQNIELDLEFQPEPKAVIEVDQNLLPYIKIENNNGKLSIRSTKEITKYRTLIVHLGFNDSLQEITASEKSVIQSQSTLKTNNISVTGLDHAKLALNIESAAGAKVALYGKAELSGKIKANEIQLKGSDHTNLDLSTESNLLKVNLQQKSKLTLNGTGKQNVYNTSGYTYLNASNHNNLKLALTTTGHAQNFVNANENFELASSKNAKTYLFGEQPKVTISNFSDDSLLLKTSKMPSNFHKIISKVNHLRDK